MPEGFIASSFDGLPKNCKKQQRIADYNCKRVKYFLNPISIRPYSYFRLTIHVIK